MDHLQKRKKRIQRFKETGDSHYIYQNELDRACFHGFKDFKDLIRGTASYKKYCEIKW